MWEEIKIVARLRYGTTSAKQITDEPAGKKENPRRDLIYQISVKKDVISYKDVINHVPTKAKTIACKVIPSDFKTPAKKTAGKESRNRE